MHLRAQLWSDDAQPCAGVTPASYAVIFSAGLLTSLSPCTLSVLPLTIGYIGGYSGTSGQSKQSSLVLRCAATDVPDITDATPAHRLLACRASAFALGLATTLALLGVGSSLVGRTYGQASTCTCAQASGPTGTDVQLHR